ITVPLALLFLSNRVLNPALVLIEVALNAYVLFVNRDALSIVWRRVMPIVLGLLPGVIAGTLIVSRVNPSWLKLGTYIILLPLIPQIMPSVLIGVPIGAFLIRHIPTETFRRVCMSFDAWVVAFGVSSVLRDIKIVEGPRAFLFLGMVILIDACLLWRFFTIAEEPEAQPEPVTPLLSMKATGGR